MYNTWQNVLENIRGKLKAPVFNTFFRDTKLVGIDGGEIIISVPSQFFVAYLEKQCQDVVESAFLECGVEFKSVQYVVDSSLKAGRKISTKKPEKVVSFSEKPAATLKNPNSHLETGLNPKYRFDNFVVGANNDLAVSAAQAVVENPGTKYNPYFIYGGPGLGKTHLIQAIGNEILEKKPGLKVKYITIEQFYSEFVDAMRHKLAGFSQKYRKVDVLIIDDIQFIVGKEKSQEEFFHTFNELYQHNKQIIIASDRLPGQIATIDERLASRMKAGMQIDIQLPDFEMRCAIIRAKVEYDGKELSPEVVEYLANNTRTNIRELEGKLNQLVAYMDMRGLSADEIIQDGYLNDLTSNATQNITPKKLVEKVAEFYQLKLSDITGPCREKDINNARQMAIFLLIEELKLSTTKAALEVGRSDHTTAMNARKKMKKKLETDMAMREQMTTLRRRIYEES